MTEIFKDGFDKYGPPGQFSPSVTTLLAGEWTAFNSPTLTVVPGLSATGNALSIFGSALNSGISRIFGNNFTRLIGGVRFNSNFGQGMGCNLGDLGTFQASISVNTTGSISLRNGGLLGTVIATSAVLPTLIANSTHYLEFDITFAAAGAYQIWVDGGLILSGTGNTKVTANSYANQICFASPSGSGNGAIIVDDFYLFSSAGTSQNAALLTNPVIETSLPINDHQRQFSASAVIGQTTLSANVTGAFTGANQLMVRKITAPVNCTINSVSFIPIGTVPLAKNKAVIYSDVGGVPTTLLSSGVEVLGTVAGVTFTGNLVTPQNLIAGTNYWIGFITDTSQQATVTDNSNLTIRVANTYTSGAPASFTGGGTAAASWEIYGNLSSPTSNWFTQNQVAPPGDASSVTSSTVGNEDLYGFAPLVGSPTNIYSVSIKSNGRRSDSGNRTVSLHMLSGAADGVGDNSGILPANTYTWLSSNFAVDPFTGVAWTNTGIANSFAGPGIAS